MKTWLNSSLTCVLWACVAGGVLYMLLAPDTGLLWRGPWSALGLGLIGAGLTVKARRSKSEAEADCV